MKVKTNKMERLFATLFGENDLLYKDKLLNFLYKLGVMHSVARRSRPGPKF